MHRFNETRLPERQWHKRSPSQQGCRALLLPVTPRSDAKNESSARTKAARHLRPTGQATRSARRFVKLLAERDIPLIEDEVYGYVGFHPVRPKMRKAFDAPRGKAGTEVPAASTPAALRCAAATVPTEARRSCWRPGPALIDEHILIPALADDGIHAEDALVMTAPVARR